MTSIATSTCNSRAASTRKAALFTPPDIMDEATLRRIFDEKLADMAKKADLKKVHQKLDEHDEHDAKFEAMELRLRLIAEGAAAKPRAGGQAWDLLRVPPVLARATATIGCLAWCWCEASHRSALRPPRK